MCGTQSAPYFSQSFTIAEPTITPSDWAAIFSACLGSEIPNPSPYMFYFFSDDIEIAHAVAYAKKIVPQMDKDEIVVITLSGRGDKDCAAIARYRGEDIHE